MIILLVWILLFTACNATAPAPPKKCTKIASVPGKVLVECSEHLDGDR